MFCEIVLFVQDYEKNALRNIDFRLLKPFCFSMLQLITTTDYDIFPAVILISSLQESVVHELKCLLYEILPFIYGIMYSLAISHLYSDFYGGTIS